MLFLAQDSPSVALHAGRNFMQTEFCFMQFHEKFLQASFHAGLQPTVSHGTFAGLMYACRNGECFSEMFQKHGRRKYAMLKCNNDIRNLQYLTFFINRT